MLAPLVALAVNCLAAANEPADGGRAQKLLDAAAAAMKEASAVAFESDLRLGVGPMEIRQKAKLLLQRPDRARLELSGAGQDALLVLDGSSASHYMKMSRGFVRSRQLGTMKLEQYGAGPAATLFFEEGAGKLAPYLADAVVTTEKIGDETCDVVAWKVGSEESRLWLAGTRLRRFQAKRSLNGQPVEQTFDYGPFDLAPRIEADAFVFTPPKGARQLDAGDESELLDVGERLADFTALTLDGARLESASLRGRPLLITFWFYG
jgi:outer membrane lipoprotein-sorting protein